MATRVTASAPALGGLPRAVLARPRTRAWRLAVAGLGPVEATADLEQAGGRIDVRVRWRYAGEGPPDAAAVERLRVERANAMGRLERLLGGRRVAVLPA